MNQTHKRATYHQEPIPSRKRRFRSRRAVFTAAVIVAVSVAVAACGGSSTPAAATHATTTPAHTSTTSAATATAGSKHQTTKSKPSLLAYSQCMRAHGVPNFPDPSSSGGIAKSQVVAATQQAGNAQATAAGNACKHLLPAGESLSGRPVQTVGAQQQQDYVKAAACMRSNGVANFPDPSFSNGQVEFHELQHLVNLNSPQVRQAYKICQKLIPAGLPYSSGSGG